MPKKQNKKTSGCCCSGPAHCPVVSAKVSNTNSVLTLNSYALPRESFVTPFADWRGFFQERMPLYLPLPPGQTSSSAALLFKPSALFVSLLRHTADYVYPKHTLTGRHWRLKSKTNNSVYLFFFFYL